MSLGSVHDRIFTLFPGKVLNPIVGSWKDNKGRKVYIRANVLRKIYNPHNLDIDTVRWAMKHPDTSRMETNYGIKSLTVREYFTSIMDECCNSWSCRVEDEVVLRSLVDFRKVGPGGKSYGLITSYRVGMVACPNWVTEPPKQR